MEGIESLWVEISKGINNEPLLICSMYRPPSASHKYFDKMVENIELASSTNMQMIILGDLNFNYQIDESLSSNPIHLVENLFQMSQIIEEPTRKTPTTSTLLDVILTSVPDRHTKTKVIKTAFSDHYSLFTTIYTGQRRQRNELHNLVKFRDYKNFNEEAFFLDLRHNDWLLHDDRSIGNNNLLRHAINLLHL